MKPLHLVLILLFLGTASSSYAQPSPSVIPIVDSAESVFRTAIQAYEDREYDVAERLFGVAANNYELHRKTTAAFLMRGKALYMQQRFAEAITVLQSLAQSYPTSRYLGEAEHLIALASGEADTTINEAPAFRLGIALPLNGDAAALSQQMFNGIHMAVDEYNSRVTLPSESPTFSPKIIMAFRDTHNNPEQARQAIRDLIEIEQVDAIIGPLFSNEAIAAAGEAERLQTVLIAPLATAEAVSFNKTYVFQANPTLEIRGRLMARFAVRSLGIKSIGILADDSNSESLGMVRGFQKELYDLSATMEDLNPRPAFQEYISNPASWFRLSDSVNRDTLLKASAVYMPINGGNATTLIGGAMQGFERMGLSNSIRVLGNKEWHTISNVSLASSYSTTYTNDFYVAPDDSLAVDFQNRYSSAFGIEPIRLSYSGYDVTNFITAQLMRYPAGSQLPLDLVLKQAGLYEGLGNCIDFSNGNINQAMFYHRYKDRQGDLFEFSGRNCR